MNYYIYGTFKCNYVKNLDIKLYVTCTLTNDSLLDILPQNETLYLNSMFSIYNDNFGKNRKTQFPDDYIVFKYLEGGNAYFINKKVIMNSEFINLKLVNDGSYIVDGNFKCSYYSKNDVTLADCIYINDGSLKIKVKKDDANVTSEKISEQGKFTYTNTNFDNFIYLTRIEAALDTKPNTRYSFSSKYYNLYDFDVLNDILKFSGDFDCIITAVSEYNSEEQKNCEYVDNNTLKLEIIKTKKISTSISPKNVTGYFIKSAYEKDTYIDEKLRNNTYGFRYTKYVNANYSTEDILDSEVKYFIFDKNNELGLFLKDISQNFEYVIGGNFLCNGSYCHYKDDGSFTLRYSDNGGASYVTPIWPKVKITSSISTSQSQNSTAVSNSTSFSAISTTSITTTISSSDITAR